MSNPRGAEGWISDLKNLLETSLVSDCNKDHIMGIVEDLILVIKAADALDTAVLTEIGRLVLATSGTPESAMRCRLAKAVEDYEIARFFRKEGA